MEVKEVVLTFDSKCLNHVPYTPNTHSKMGVKHEVQVPSFVLKFRSNKLMTWDNH